MTTPQMLERAREIAIQYTRDCLEAKGDRMSDSWPDECRAGKYDVLHTVQIALAALTPPAGMVVVPVEATEEMLEAGGNCYGDSMTSDVWSAMLSAAPSSPPPADVRDGLVGMREYLRATMLAQPTTDERETYSDGFAQGICFAIGEIDKAAPGLKFIEPTDVRDGIRREALASALIAEIERQTDGNWPLDDGSNCRLVDAHLDFDALAAAVSPLLIQVVKA